MINEIQKFIRQFKTAEFGTPHIVGHRPLSFSRFPHIALPPATIQVDYLQTIRNRSTCRRGTGDLSSSDLGNLFGCSMQVNPGNINRPYPSGGSYYPIEAYYIGKLPETDTHFVYHYDPDIHVLNCLWPFTKPDTVESLFSGTEDAMCTGAIILTARIDEQTSKYGNFAYQLSLLEAGHIGQNIVLAAAALELCICPHGGYHDAELVELLDLDQTKEIPVYGFTLSKHPS